MSHHMTDAMLDELVSLGSARCHSEVSWDAPIMPPKPPDWAKNRHLMLRRQLVAFGGAENLLEHYAELLVRCQQLVDFFNSNVGIDDEWPLMLMGESEEVEMLLGKLVAKADHAVGTLTEI